MVKVAYVLDTEGLWLWEAIPQVESALSVQIAASTSVMFSGKLVLAKTSAKSGKDVSLKEHFPCSSITKFKINYTFYYLH